MKMKNKINWYFFAIAFIFFILKIIEIQFKFSDGYTYMYMGKLILQGLIPYKDFFFASPPLQAYISSLFELIVGSKILFLKLIPIFATLGSSFFIFRFMKKNFGDWQGITASTLYLFSFFILLTTDYFTGINLTMFFILGAIYFIDADKPIIAGIFAGLAMLTRLYAPFPIFGMGIYLLIFKRKQFWKFTTITLGIFVLVSLIFEIISNGAYLNQIFFFRLNLISGIGLSKFAVFKFFILGDLVLVLGSTLWLFFDKEKNKLLLPLFATIPSLFLYLIYSDIYYLYFGLILGFFAMFTTKLIFEMGYGKSFKKILIIFLIILVLLNSFLYISNYASASNINFTKDIVKFVKENSFENESIYGNFEITPLVAILSNRKISENIADTNPKNIMTGEFKIQDIEKKLNNTKFIIVKANILPDDKISDFDASTPINYLKENCRIVKIYPLKNDFSSNSVILFECKKIKLQTSESLQSPRG